MPDDTTDDTTEGSASGSATSTDSADEIASLRNEAARSRVQRNQALKEAHALKHVLKSHNINFDTDLADLGDLKIEHGAVRGEFKYELPKGTGKPVDSPLPDTKGASKLTMDDVRTMSPDKINENWEEVSKLLKETK